MQRAFKFLVVIAAPLLLLSCFMTPGKFVSALDVARDGSFVFTYKGEFIFISSQSMMGDSTPPEFKPACEDDAGAARECNKTEIAEQKKKFDDEQAAKAERDAKSSKEMASTFGGIDPSNEKTMDEFAARLQREVGWKSVVHRGKGVFDVDYEMRGKLDRDFVFPLFPRFNLIFPAVIISRRDDNALLIRAPGFGASDSGSEAAGPFGPGGGGSKADGVFTLTTDADIATNNSEEGATMVAGRHKVEWRVTPLNRTPPEALLRLGK